MNASKDAASKHTLRRARPAASMAPAQVRPRTLRTAQAVLATLVAFALVFGACGPQDSKPLEKVNGHISGQVVKGLVEGALVTVYDSEGRVVGTATTDASGNWSMDTGIAIGRLRIVTEGGTYVAESTGETVRMGQTQLVAYYPDFPVGEAVEGVEVNPITTLVAAYTDWRMEALGETFEDAFERAKFHIHGHFGGVDWARVLPTDVTRDAAVQITPEITAGVLLAGLSWLGKTASGDSEALVVNGAALTDALARDIRADGYFNGKGDNGVTLSVGDYTLDGQTLRHSYVRAIAGFLNSGRNATALGVMEYEDLLTAIATNGPSQQEVEAGLVPGKHIFDSYNEAFDLTPPEIAWEGLGEGDVVRGEVDFSVVATDTKVVGLEFVAPALLATVPATGLGTSRATLATTLNAGAFPDGALEITARAVDEAGNERVDTIHVTVANEAPTIEVITPMPGDVLSGTVRVEATAMPNPSTGAAIVSLTVLSPEGISDTATAADSFVADWDTTTAPEGDLDLRFEAVDALGTRATLRVPVTIDNRPPPVLEGTVVVAGRPVNYPRVTVHAVDARSTAEPLGPVIGEGVGGDDGTFSVTVTDESYGGPLLVVVRDAAGQSTLFDNPVTGTQVRFASDDALSLFLPGPYESQATTGWSRLVVTPWTTIAASYALFLLEDAATPATPLQAFNDLRTYIAGHFKRVDPYSLHRAMPLDLSDPALAPLDLEVAYPALADFGLLQLAARIATEQDTTFSPLALTRLLARDLSDGVFDGRHPGGVLQIADYEFSANTTRTELAYALDDFVSGPLNASGLTREMLLNAGVYQDIATDTSRIYPAGPAPEFDRTPPVLVLVDPTVQGGTFGTEDVAIHVQARDEGPDASGIDPATFQLDVNASTPGLVVGGDRDPRPDYYYLSIPNDVAPSDGMDVVAVFQVQDQVGNAATPLEVRFTRTPASVQIVRLKALDNVQTLDPPYQVNGGFRIHAQGVFGFAPVDWSAPIKVERTGGAPLPAGVLGPDADSSDTFLDVPLDPSPLPDGPLSLDVVLRTIAGEEVRDTVVVTLDRNAPTLSMSLAQQNLLKQIDGEWWLPAVPAGSGAATVDIDYTVQDAVVGVDTVRLSSSAPGFVAPPAETPGPCIAAPCTGRFTVTLGDGEVHVLRVHAADTLGNQTSTPALQLRVDATPPTVRPTFPAPGSWNRDLTVDFTLTDAGSKVTLVTLSARNDDTGEVFETTQQYPAAASIVNAVTLTGLSSGTYTVTLQATDRAGNSASVTQSGILVDTDAPTCTGVTPLGNPGTDGSGNPIYWYGGASSPANVGFAVTATDAGGSPCQIQVDVLDEGGSTSTTPDAGSCSGGTATVAKADGRYTVTLSLIDAAGNVAVCPISPTVWVDTTKPKVLGAGTGGAVISATEIDYRWNAALGDFEYVNRSGATVNLDAARTGTLQLAKFEHRLGVGSAADPVAAALANNLPVYYFDVEDQPGAVTASAAEVRLEFLAGHAPATDPAAVQWAPAWQEALPVGLIAGRHRYAVYVGWPLLGDHAAFGSQAHHDDVHLFKVRAVDPAGNVKGLLDTYRLQYELLPAPVGIEPVPDYPSQGDPESIYALSITAHNIHCLASSTIDSRCAGLPDRFRVAKFRIHMPHQGCYHPQTTDTHCEARLYADTYDLAFQSFPPAQAALNAEWDLQSVFEDWATELSCARISPLTGCQQLASAPECSDPAEGFQDARFYAYWKDLQDNTCKTDYVSNPNDDRPQAGEVFPMGQWPAAQRLSLEFWPQGATSGQTNYPFLVSSGVHTLYLVVRRPQSSDFPGLFRAHNGTLVYGVHLDHTLDGTGQTLVTENPANNGTPNYWDYPGRTTQRTLEVQKPDPFHPFQYICAANDTCQDWRQRYRELVKAATRVAFKPSGLRATADRLQLNFTQTSTSIPWDLTPFDPNLSTFDDAPAFHEVYR